MKRALAGVAALAMAMLLAAPSFAASPSEALRVDRVDVAKYPTVRATVTVPAALGSDDLPAEAFSVDEDGRSRPISVTRVPGDELELVLLMDTSGSMRDALDDAKAAATEFVSQLPDDTRVAVLGFSRRPYVVQRFTEDKAALVAAVDSLRVRGSTALYDGVAEALAQFEESSAQPSIVLLSDGADSSSSLSMRRLERRLQRDSVTLHAIELRSGKANRAALGHLTDAAGGQLVSAGDAQALEGVYSEIGDQLVNQYVVEYQSMAHGRTPLELAVGHHGERAVAKTVVDLPAAPPSLRVLSVDAKDHPEVQVRVVAPRELAERELRDGAFTIMEGAEARDVRVTKVAPADLEVVLAVDTSGSMRGEPLEAVKEAALRFIGALPLEARIAIVAFAEEPAVVFPFSTDRAGARAAVGGLEAGAETALYDAAVAVSRLFDVHAVQLETAETDAETLQRLTRQTGGEVIQARDATALREAYDAVAESVSNQYVLRYRSDAYGGADLVVRVEEGSVRAEAEATAILPPLPRAKALLGSRAGLIVGAALCYVAMALLLLNVVVPRQRRSVITGSAAARRDRHTGLAELAHRATQLADETLQARGYGSKLNAALEKAGVNLSLDPPSFGVVGDFFAVWRKGCRARPVLL
jgi:VWFA-related protein